MTDRKARALTRRNVVALLAAIPGVATILGANTGLAQQPDPHRPLPSWNDGATRDAIISFVEEVTSESSSNFVPPPHRIAAFDNDGTLWCEHPMYVQLAFALARTKELAPQHPEWQSDPLFKAVLDDDMKGVAAFGERGLLKLVLETHAGMTTREFEQIVASWLASARHPRFKRPYTQLVYQPMLDLMAYLRAMDFQIHIVSGGGIEFMRPWTEQVYGVQPQRVVGSSTKTRFQLRDGSPELFRLPELNFVDDGPGKPVGINAHIGRRPVMAFGNSDGDLEMLQWTTLGGMAGFGLLVHHTDAEREYAYDKGTEFGRLDKALEAAALNKWTVVDMKRDWAAIFPPEK
ncbi:MAG: HAD family hydrolase [Alsobacter sp.]